MTKQTESAKQADVTEPATRRRGAELEEAILHAAWGVLVERGYQGFTIEAVAERAQTSRPVLYRRWPQRNDLLLATVARYFAAHPIKVPDTGSLRDDAIGLLRNANTARASMTVMLGAQLSDYFRQTGTSFAELRGSLHQGEASPFEIIVERAVARGELRKTARSARVVNLPLDLLRHEIFMSLRAAPDALILEIIDELWLPLLQLSKRR